jgi:hypothetical protein
MLAISKDRRAILLRAICVSWTSNDGLNGGIAASSRFENIPTLPRRFLVEHVRMPELDAEWDPVSRQVTFKPRNGAVYASKITEKEEGQKRNEMVSEEKKHNFEWRNDENKVNSSSRRRSRGNSSKRQPSEGIASSSFHQNSEKQGQDFVQRLRSQSTKRMAQSQTNKWRENEEKKRQAFKSLTVYKTYPLQEQAVQQWRQLRQEWGVVNEETEEIVTDMEATRNLTCSEIGSSSSSLSSRDLPEAKRCLRDREASPAESQQSQQFKKEFLEQRSIKMTTTPNSFGSALYSLEPRLFAVEKQGRKMRYVCAHAGRFFDKYWGKTEPVHRHAYELIRPNTPCRLYFDIECDIEVNHIWKNDIDMRERFLNELVAELSSELQSRYGSVVLENQSGEQYRLQTLERKHIVDLESSTEKKFSRHWIVHIPAMSEKDTDNLITTEVLFPHSAAVGNFVRSWIGRLAEEQATGQLQSKRPTLNEHLFVRSNSKAAIDSVRCVIDLGVYTRNRLFRIMGSTKSGKPMSAALHIAETNEFPFPPSFQNGSFYGPAMEKKRYELRTLSQHDDEDVDHIVKKHLSKIDWAFHAEALAQTLVVPLNSAKIDYPILAAADEDEMKRSIPPVTRSLKSSNFCMSTTLSHGLSSYPMLDEFVTAQLANRGGIQGMIRAWSIDYESTTAESTPKPRLISYQITRNRWCECVGRAHKSNNIAWNIDFRMFHCYQTCHDPDCRAANFRGTPVPLPEIVTEALQDAIFEQELAGLDISKLEHHDDKIANESTNHVTIDEFNDFALDQALASLDIDVLIANRQSSTLKDFSLQSSEEDSSLKSNKTDTVLPTRQSSNCRTERNFSGLGLDATREADSNLDAGNSDVLSSTSGAHASTPNNKDGRHRNTLIISRDVTNTTVRPPFGAADSDDSEDDIDLVAIAREIDRIRTQKTIDA